MILVCHSGDSRVISIWRNQHARRL